MHNVSLNPSSATARGRGSDDLYTVQHGDTLSGIAAMHGVSLASVASANPQLRDLDRLAVGQAIRLPQAAPHGAPYTVKQGDTLWDIAKRQGLSVRELEAANPQLKADRFERIYPGDVLSLPPTQHQHPAAAPAASTTPAPPLKQVRDAVTHGLDQAQRQLQALARDARHAMDKLQAPAARPVQPPAAATPARQPLPAAKPTPAGTLRLGNNQALEATIRAAAARTGTTPEALAAVIDAEAGKKTLRVPLMKANGTPLLDKHGKPAMQKVQVWDASSHNASGAAGLTQFLKGTWLNEAMRPGTFLNQKAMEHGWVRMEQDAKGRQHPQFVLADGKTTSEPFAKRHLHDANVQALLAQRFDAGWSINAAADYGARNLALLDKAGFKLDGLSAGERAKLMYLMHHEGEGNGPRFIQGTLDEMPKGRFASSEARLKSIFAQQVGSSEANKMIDDASGDVQLAYRKWLGGYIDSKIRLERFGDVKESPDLNDILARVGGQAIGKPKQ
ncbi:LysM peptidoglycan-binding domain-containing protein [Chitinivorax sp. PXF-14]|uniref:LysM peptidoglycan-binding domain-containing protein n=1 Tax=Chitinivorax sp. PXF-14 TaxID=3230488 RepID=UPI003465E7BD